MALQWRRVWKWICLRRGSCSFLACFSREKWNEHLRADVLGLKMYGSYLCFMPFIMAIVFSVTSTVLQRDPLLGLFIAMLRFFSFKSPCARAIVKTEKEVGWLFCLWYEVDGYVERPFEYVVIGEQDSYLIVWGVVGLVEIFAKVDLSIDVEFKRKGVSSRH